MERLLSFTSEAIDKDHLEELLNIVQTRYNVTIDEIIESRNQIEVSDDMYYSLDMLMIDPIKWYNQDLTRKEPNLDINFVKELKKYTCQFNKYKCRIIKDAAKNNHLECVKYLHKNGENWDDLTSLFAAKNGNLECLKYARENDCPWNILTCTEAAENGHLECLKYAHENGCDWNTFTCAAAAKHGHLECLRYAYENGCDWDEVTCEIAAKNDYLECLKYAIENGCPYNKDICIKRARDKCIEYLKSL